MKRNEALEKALDYVRQMLMDDCRVIGTNPQIIECEQHFDVIRGTGTIHKAMKATFEWVPEVFKDDEIDVFSDLGFRPLVPSDIVQGATVFVFTDDYTLKEMKIDEVLRPDDQYKAFCADDGCRYGSDGVFVRVDEEGD
jgi:hypothetical protein